MNYYRNNIRHVKGDTFSHGLTIEGLENQEPESISFTCRDGLNDDSRILFQSTIYDGVSLVEHDTANDIRKYAVRVSPDKTKDLQSGTYYYDEEVRINGDVFTIMRGIFTIEQDNSRGGV